MMCEAHRSNCIKLKVSCVANSVEHSARPDREQNRNMTKERDVEFRVFNKCMHDLIKKQKLPFPINNTR